MLLRQSVNFLSSHLQSNFSAIEDALITGSLLLSEAALVSRELDPTNKITIPTSPGLGEKPEGN
ncbi:hypothetical protein OAL23_00455 [bacterium]|nr:hypothetical protein [bacterium]